MVLGKTGAGKSSALRHAVEWLLKHDKRVCIIDPKGDWWGLKSSADGKRAGFPVIAFGDFKNPDAQDIPLNPQSGKHVAELISSGNRPCIIGFRGWMPSQMTDFWLEFASVLFNSSHGELYVVIDEVHNFAPKGKILDPKAGRLLHWTNRLLSEGRGLGLVFLIASQRPQKVHNDTLTCCETLVAMRVNHAADRNAIKEWIDGCGDKEHGQIVLNTVAQMARGEAYVWSPEIALGPERIKFPMFKTFDSFAPPQLQETVSESGWADVDLQAVKEKLATVIKESQENDPRFLKQRIMELQRQTAVKMVPQPGPPKIEYRVDELALREAVKRQGREFASMMEEVREGLDELDKKVLSIKQRVGGLNEQIVNRTKPLTPNIVVNDAIPRNAVVFKSGNSHAVIKNTGEVKIRAGALRMLQALAQYYPEMMTTGRMRAHAGMKKSGTFSTYMSDLRKAGFIEERGDTVGATTAGVDFCGGLPPAPRTTEEVLNLWRPKLRDGARRMLDYLILQGEVTKEELAVGAGMTASGTFSTYLSDLKTAKLIIVNRHTVAPDKETLIL